jgi:sugar O-acyltransferase (sialic acid O-acetyltransferase NeuD family)
VIVAASGLAREVIAVEHVVGRFDDFVVLDDDPSLWGTALDGVPVSGGVDEVGRYPEHDVVVCAGRGATRRALVGRLAALGVTEERYCRVVHPAASMAGATIGRGTIVLAGAVATANVTIGRHVVTMPNVTLTHDDVIGDYATLCANVALGGGVRVDEDAYLGMSSCVREGGEVGSRATLGMGAVLLEPLPEGATWVGVPARPLASPAYRMEGA